VRRPFVLLNAAVSLDGKLAPASRRKVRLGSDRDRARMDQLRAGSDAILIGAGTLRAEDPPLQVRSPRWKRWRRREGLPEHLLQVVLSGTLDLPLEGRFFGANGPPRLVAAPRGVGTRRLRATRKSSDVLLTGRAGRVDIAALLTHLRTRRKVKRLLVEGGGETFAHFFEVDCVDEIHLTVCPLIVGGRTAPTLFDGRGFEILPLPRFRLDLCRREGEEVYLRYRR
jgi:riboflavin-specific deaminase-like protein